MQQHIIATPGYSRSRYWATAPWSLLGGTSLDSVSTWLSISFGHGDRNDPIATSHYPSIRTPLVPNHTWIYYAYAIGQRLDDHQPTLLPPHINHAAALHPILVADSPACNPISKDNHYLKLVPLPFEHFHDPTSMNLIHIQSQYPLNASSPRN